MERKTVVSVQSGGYISNYIICPNLCERCTHFSFKKGFSSSGDYHCDLRKVNYDYKAPASWKESRSARENITHNECDVFEDKYEAQIKAMAESNKEALRRVEEEKKQQQNYEKTVNKNIYSVWKCFHCGQIGSDYTYRTLFYGERFHSGCFEEYKETDTGKKWVEERETEEAEKKRYKEWIEEKKRKEKKRIYPFSVISCIIIFILFAIAEYAPSGGFIIWGILLVLVFISAHTLCSLHLSIIRERSRTWKLILSVGFLIIVWPIFISISAWLVEVVLEIFSSPQISTRSSIRGAE